MNVVIIVDAVEGYLSTYRTTSIYYGNIPMVAGEVFGSTVATGGGYVALPSGVSEVATLIA